jgi:hypothetical protein
MSGIKVPGDPLTVSEALGISLSEVHDLYFGDRDEVERDHIVEEAQECHREDCKYEEEREEVAKEERRWELRSYYEDDTF